MIILRNPFSPISFISTIQISLTSTIISDFFVYMFLYRELITKIVTFIMTALLLADKRIVVVEILSCCLKTTYHYNLQNSFS